MALPPSSDSDSYEQLVSEPAAAGTLAFLWRSVETSHDAMMSATPATAAAAVAVTVSGEGGDSGNDGGDGGGIGGANCGRGVVAPASLASALDAATAALRGGTSGEYAASASADTVRVALTCAAADVLCRTLAATAAASAAAAAAASPPGSGSAGNAAWRAATDLAAAAAAARAVCPAGAYTRPHLCST